MPIDTFNIAMFCIHSCPIGELGTKDTGGMNVYVRELAGELGRRGHHVDIYTRYHDPRDKQLIRLSKNVRLIHLKAGKNGQMPKLAMFPYLDDFIDELEKFQKHHGLCYDLIHSHYWLSGQVGAWAQHFWKIPHVIMFHTLGKIKNLTGVSLPEPKLRINTEKQLVQSCHRTIAATLTEKEHLIQHYNALPETVAVAPCGVNLNLFRPIDKTTARQKIGFDNHCKLVLYVGRSDPLKGLDRLLEAIKLLASGWQPDAGRLKLVIIGGDVEDMAEKQKTDNLCKRLAIDHIVTFIGSVDQQKLPFYYSAADVLAAPSHYESFGLVALESLACGTPVVATRVGAIDTIIKKKQSGYIVPEASPPLIAEGIKACLNSPESPVQTAEAIRATVLKFGWNRVADAIIAEYCALIRHT